MPEVEGTYRMNPAQAKSAAKQKSLDLAHIKLQGVGTHLTGFARGKYGPFHCGGCDWFGKNSCSHPTVRLDRQVPHTADGNAKVDADDCCDHYWPKGLAPGEYQAD